MQELNLNNQQFEKRKFRILEIIAKKPHLEAVELMRSLPFSLSITRQTFSSYCNAHINSNVEIPSSKMFILSQLLEVEIYELFNKALFENNPAFDTEIMKKNLKNKTGLIL